MRSIAPLFFLFLHSCVASPGHRAEPISDFAANAPQHTPLIGFAVDFYTENSVGSYIVNIKGDVVHKSINELASVVGSHYFAIPSHQNGLFNIYNSGAEFCFQTPTYPIPLSGFVLGIPDDTLPASTAGECRVRRIDPGVQSSLLYWRQHGILWLKHRQGGWAAYDNNLNLIWTPDPGWHVKHISNSLVTIWTDEGLSRGRPCAAVLDHLFETVYYNDSAGIEHITHAAGEYFLVRENGQRILYKRSQKQLIMNDSEDERLVALSDSGSVLIEREDSISRPGDPGKQFVDYEIAYHHGMHGYFVLAHKSTGCLLILDKNFESTLELSPPVHLIHFSPDGFFSVQCDTWNTVYDPSGKVLVKLQLHQKSRMQN